MRGHYPAAAKCLRRLFLGSAAGYHSVVKPGENNSESILRDLTEPQREAVTHTEGPLLVVAAAGSGKTRVITRRVAYLMSQGVEPRSILAITFTNKAANEMRQRVSASSPRPFNDWGRLDQPWPIICTFHSLCLRILKYYAGAIGLPGNFSVYDSADQGKLMKEAIKSLDLSTTNFAPGTVHGTISNAKNKLQDAQAYARAATGFYEQTVARVFAKYQQLLDTNNALDFDDLLLRTADAMRQHPKVLAELQERFRYILVDEYQDTNHAQYVIAHALALKHRNICVVGDPDQSIYAWRGADLNNILDFEKDYPDATVIRLEQNYRSTQSILAIAQKLISHNVKRKDKTLWTQNPAGVKARVLFCQDEHDEARAVAEELTGLQKSGIPWSKMAIFYRMNALSRVMEDALRRGEIPYQIARGVEFYNRKEIKDVLAYLRTIANPRDEVSLTRIINVPTRGIGDGSVKLMEAHAVANGTSLWETMCTAKQIEGLSTRAANGVESFVRMIESLREVAKAPPVQKIMELVIRRSGMEEMLRKQGAAGESELENVLELISAAAEYDKENPEGSLDDYLSRVSLVSDADHLAGSGGAVTLMTLHAAKGLEFPVVAIIGLEEGCLPHARSRESMDELEEERRLCFVGITRAQERVILSKAAYRTIRGLRERTATSQFLMQMPQEMLETVDFTGDGDVYEPLRGMAMEFQVGQAVAHAAFGVGRILEMSNSGINTRAIVQFPRYGQKTLIVEYANLKPVGKNSS